MAQAKAKIIQQNSPRKWKYVKKRIDNCYFQSRQEKYEIKPKYNRRNNEKCYAINIMSVGETQTML